MAYVVYELDTTLTIREPYVGTKLFKTEGAAKAARTRAGFTTATHGVAEANNFSRNIEKKRIVKNLLSGTEVEESVNTPNYLSVGSEAYWSM